MREVRSITRITTLAALALAALVVLGGCNRLARTAPVVVGPMIGAPSIEAFERLLQTARAQGYEVDGEDRSLGVFRVGARWTSPQGAHRFHVQCFASGHVQVVAAGPRVQRYGSDYVMPRPLRDELIAFTQGLAAGAGVSRAEGL